MRESLKEQNVQNKNRAVNVYLLPQVCTYIMMKLILAGVQIIGDIT